ncbi:MAG: tetratricopeptide repeat protein, partial [Hyphomicrobium sp.]
EIYPKLACAYHNRGLAYAAKGDHDRAIADYTKLIEINPKSSRFALWLGLARYNNGDFKGAATDLLRAVELEDDVYAMLFRYLARTRAGATAEAELEANAGRLKTKEWPYAVIELYLGKRSPAATLDAAVKPDDRCKAQFYIGQWHVLKGNVADAQTALTVAVETCPKTFSEYVTAVAELKRLKP